MEIRETQIEDVLVNAPVLTKKILGLKDEPRLLGRQIIVPSGRLDMLYAYQSKLLLLELKVVPFQRKFLNQVLDYKRDLISFQNAGRLLKGQIDPYLLCPDLTKTQVEAGVTNGVRCFRYSPEEVLEFFYSNLKSITSFVKIKPIDIGIWNIHLINPVLFQLLRTRSVKSLQDSIGGSKKTLYNKIRFAQELGLIEWKANSDQITLSELGEQYVQARDEDYMERLSEAQAEILKQHIIQNPFQSSVILGIASVVESIFSYSKNVYPVPMSELCDYFTLHSGKVYDWKTDKAKYSATRMYSNYAVDLGLVAKTDQSIYLTPQGVKFTVQMQLHKSLKMVDNLTIN
jgi:hypothetical protein